ncbi:MAG: DUF3179 domain-containing (seleno)protein, partial [Desulfosarcina sp.]|nr:DUF3179 domain-containing (seleno)protein [Desulfosarcina sp.]
VLYDKETGTLWYPENDGLLGIQGVFFQRRLPKLKSNDTQWSTWVKSNPSTRLMKYASVQIPQTLKVLICRVDLIDRHEDANHGECWR